MSDATLTIILQFITALGVSVSSVIIAFINKGVTAKLQDIKVTTEKTQETGEKVHVLVNSEHGVALRALANALKVIADYKPTSDNINAALIAKNASDAHDKV